MAFCGGCGQELQPGWKACPRCGVLHEPEGPAPRAFPRPLLLIAAIATLLVLIVVAVVIATGPKKSASVRALDARKTPDATIEHSTASPRASNAPQNAAASGESPAHSTSTSTAVGAAAEASPPPPITLSGQGKSVSKRFDVIDGLAVFRAHCACVSNFVVELLNSSGSEEDVLVNVIGTYDGSLGYGFVAGGYMLKIEADKPWTVTVTQPRASNGPRVPQKFTGRGQQLVGPFTAGDAVNFDAHNHGEGNFVVELLSSDGETQDIPFNEIGNFEGSTVSNDLSGSPYYLNVDSDGTWSIDVRAP